MAKFLISAVLMVCLAAADASGIILGGWKDADPNRKDVQIIAKFAASTANRWSNSLYHKKLVQVIEAQTAVVAGLKYKLKIEIRPTVCRKRDVRFLNVENCDIDENAASEICDVTIFDQVWTSTRSIIELLCHRQESETLPSNFFIQPN